MTSWDAPALCIQHLLAFKKVCYVIIIMLYIREYFSNDIVEVNGVAGYTT